MKASNKQYTPSSPRRSAAGNFNTGSQIGRRRTYDEHRVRYLVLANAASQNDHPRLLGFSRELVQVSDVLNDVHNEAGIAE